MNSPASQPGLPTWLFVVTDLALIAAAAAIAVLSPAPLSTPAMLLIVGCVGLGAVVGLVPLVARYERLKNETLDNRQRALESLSQTVHETAQQISIATGSLHEIADLAQKNLRHAEHLPHKLQEKIAEFQAQLADANDAEKAELEQELTALRTSESERLESISTKIAKAAADWAKLEAATAQHLATLQDTLGRFPAQANAEFGKLQDVAAKAAGTARESALQSLQKAEVDALRRLAEAHGASLTTLQTQVTTLEERILAAASAASDRAAADFRSSTTSTIQALDSKLAQLAALAAALQAAAESMARAVPAAPPPAPTFTPTVEAPSPAAAEPTAGATAETAPADAPSAAPPIASPPAPKRQRRTRKEDGVPTNPPLPVPADAAAAEPLPAESPAASIPPSPAPEAPASAEETAPSATPSAAATPPDDLTLPPFAMTAPAAPPSPPSAESPALPPATPANPSPPLSPAGDSASAPAPVRKRAPRKPEPAPEPGLDLGFDDSTPAAGSGHVEQTLSSDGATRLIATAYIGIGNRLFIRGDGPGLSWERGVPLQFVSIGKWRWETNDATAPIRFKLYKNDEHECVALGEKILDPGHLHELVASF